MSWIQTYTGMQFWPLGPRREDVRLEDIAHALANQCRFNGHCRKFYSIAQHSVLVANDLLARGFAGKVVTAGLFHDAAEAYLPDICSPIKGAFPDFRVFERRLLAVIFDAIGIGVRGVTQLEWDAIKESDARLLATEARDLMGPPPEPWEGLPLPLPDKISPWSPKRSKRAFLAYIGRALGPEVMF